MASANTITMANAIKKSRKSFHSLVVWSKYRLLKPENRIVQGFSNWKCHEVSFLGYTFTTEPRLYQVRSSIFQYFQSNRLVIKPLRIRLTDHDSGLWVDLVHRNGLFCSRKNDTILIKKIAIQDSTNNKVFLTLFGRVLSMEKGCSR